MIQWESLLVVFQVLHRSLRSTEKKCGRSKSSGLHFLILLCRKTISCQVEPLSAARKKCNMLSTIGAWNLEPGLESRWKRKGASLLKIVQQTTATKCTQRSTLRYHTKYCNEMLQSIINSSITDSSIGVRSVPWYFQQETVASQEISAPWLSLMLFLRSACWRLSSLLHLNRCSSSKIRVEVSKDYSATASLLVDFCVK